MFGFSLSNSYLCKQIVCETRHSISNWSKLHCIRLARTLSTEMKELQFSVVVLTTLMCSVLLLQMPERVKCDKVSNRSRWLMIGALTLIGLQFLIQYVTQLRELGVTQAVLVNLTFFIPGSALMSLSVLNLQRHGQLFVIERWGWLVCWLVVTTGLAVAVVMDGNPLENLSERVRWTEVTMSIVYAGMQVYYSIMQLHELQRMEAAIENYFDRERKGLTMWMKHAIAITGLMAIFVPILIFGPNIVLIIYGLSFFWGIFIMWFSFIRYFTSNDILQVHEAEAEAETGIEETEYTLSPNTMRLVSRAVERWLATGEYLKTGITSPNAAEAMNIPRHQLTAWVKTSGHSSFTRWIISLRIEEAKRLLREHPDWNNETVADHCGFSRAYFQKIFKQETGKSPSGRKQ